MRNIIISGGGLVNKGAQAMTLLSICELKKRFPEDRIYLLSWNTCPAEKQRYAMYDLELLQIPPLKFAGAAHSPLKRAAYTLRYGKTFTETDKIYRDTRLLIDISGYALGSNWSAKVCHDYLNNIEHALAYGIPVYLLPQSFGPFDFQGEAGENLDARVRRLLPRVKLICAREEAGYQALCSSYGLEGNTILHNDLVLTSRLTDYALALKETIAVSLPEIPENSICVIPNVRVSENGVNQADSLYLAAMEAALALGLRVYITYHSAQDKALCAHLNAAFADNDRVVFLDHDYGCMEFNELVKQFRFVVASRFHSIVHALKNGVPCIALGWAVKYIELLNLFGQGGYLFDLRQKVDAQDVQAAIVSMNRNVSAESQKIKHTLPDLQRENVFDFIKEP